MSLPYPSNAPGDFYVANNECIACQAPEEEAPSLMTHNDSEKCGYHCYFHRQPESPEELEEAVYAVAVSCCRSVRYAGNDPNVIGRLEQLNSLDSCDAIPEEKRREATREVPRKPWLAAWLRNVFWNQVTTENTEATDRYPKKSDVDHR